VESRRIPRRQDEFCIEHYINDPRNTPEDRLQTAILVPTL
jgi:DNA gyrase inhibitor GyrI